MKQKLTKANLKKNGVLSELDKKIYATLLDLDAKEISLCLIVKQIQKMQSEIEELENRRIKLRHKILTSYDELRELFHQKLNEGINENDIAALMDEVVTLRKKKNEDTEVK